ncbi:MAG: LysM peptidoglycan-binding domain-containing protein [Gemmatimonadetes bacterium]|nr:LysM peptidoglycan-binding domain-containing protein [Gemmatimonadota bacterium]NIQ52889.1 LysM peptidoglycan-binding domain-containing protein [Gemmatimonadota bacterium]NIU73017.1 LysM peptidoglycan-binding domain-containing protein [Gammaproteobacteria bacterium]NIX43363.1 LysM peptidoglycan-binding domain-containing protein [Gemmatimonadota bacterium]NIY07536.1 LysM peptidoglycan-binding domain-containing protein [Gemmatimonadota bacterium]
MRLVTASLVGLLVAAPLLAQEPVRDREHVVREGDTLWDLAGFYYSDPFVWPVIYRANTVVVEDPHWIYPDEVLTIPWRPDMAEVADAAPAAPQPVAMGSARTVFYREAGAVPESQGPTVIIEPEARRTPVREGEFTAAPYPESTRELVVQGRMLRALRENRRVGGTQPTAHPQEVVYLEYVTDNVPTIGQEVVLVDVGRRLAGGRVITPTAVLEILELRADVMEARIAQQFGPVYPRQLVVPKSYMPEFDVEEAEPVQGGWDLEGRIMEFADEEPLYGPTEWAFINLGYGDDVAVGDVFLAHLPTRDDEQTEAMRYAAGRPTEAVAELRVIRVQPGTATVKVDQVMIPELEKGMSIRRVRRIP